MKKTMFVIATALVSVAMPCFRVDRAQPRTRRHRHSMIVLAGSGSTSDIVTK